MENSFAPPPLSCRRGVEHDPLRLFYLVPTAEDSFQTDCEASSNEMYV